MNTILPILLGILMIIGAVGHIVAPEAYSELIPYFISEFVAHLLSIITETGVGVGLLIPKYRKHGALAFIALMIAFLPIHIWDLLKDEPFVGSQTLAIVRLAIQFILIYAGWWIYKKYKS